MMGRKRRVLGMQGHEHERLIFYFFWVMGCTSHQCIAVLSICNDTTSGHSGTRKSVFRRIQSIRKRTEHTLRFLAYMMDIPNVITT